MALRAYRDPAGGEWRVWHVMPDTSFSTLEASYRDGWLCFERVDGSDRCRLSMSQAPSGWDTLPDERLDMLRRTAEVATRRPATASRRADGKGTGMSEREKRRD